MRIFYDNNNFIRETVSNESLMENPWLNEITFNGVTSLSVIDEYYLPLNKLVDGVPVEVTDPADYQIDQKLWELYLRKLHDEVRLLVNTKTNQELKVIYDASPDYKRAVIGDEINKFWWDQIPQTRINMTYEIIHRIIAELMYIERVEQRVLTFDEQLAVLTMLTTLHQHNTILELPLNSTGWYISYFTSMLEVADNLRAGHIPQRIEVMGEADGQIYG